MSDRDYDLRTFCEAPKVIPKVCPIPTDEKNGSDVADSIINTRRKRSKTDTGVSPRDRTSRLVPDTSTHHDCQPPNINLNRFLKLKRPESQPDFSKQLLEKDDRIATLASENLKLLHENESLRKKCEDLQQNRAFNQLSIEHQKTIETNRDLMKQLQHTKGELELKANALDTVLHQIQDLERAGCITINIGHRVQCQDSKADPPLCPAYHESFLSSITPTQPPSPSPCYKPLTHPETPIRSANFFLSAQTHLVQSIPSTALRAVEITNQDMPRLQTSISQPSSWTKTPETLTATTSTSATLLDSSRSTISRSNSEQSLQYPSPSRHPTPTSITKSMSPEPPILGSKRSPSPSVRCQKRIKLEESGGDDPASRPETRTVSLDQATACSLHQKGQEEQNVHLERGRDGLFKEEEIIPHLFESDGEDGELLICPFCLVSSTAPPQNFVDAPVAELLQHYKEYHPHILAKVCREGLDFLYSP
uniref:Uncharacterized protein n=1 Tax=Moniliophthora roreri TaxID=221103 RepID=A0A0W0GAL0_MONRR